MKKSNNKSCDSSVLEKYLFKGDKREFIKTNMYLIDNFIAGFMDVEKGRGGFERGKLYSFSGIAGIGKTTFLLDVCKKLCSNGYKVVYIDVEMGLNDKLLKDMGLDVYKVNEIDEIGGKDKNFIIFNAETYKDVIEIIKEFEKIKVDFVVIDSIKHLLTSQEYESNSEDLNSLLLDKRIEGVFFPLIKSFARKNGFCVVFVQQVRLQKKGQFFVTGESGGNAFLHSMDCRFILKKSEEIKMKYINNANEVEERVAGFMVDIQTLKSRFGSSSIKVPILFGKGVSLIFYIIKLLINLEILSNKKGNSYVFDVDRMGDEFSDLRDVSIKSRDLYRFFSINYERFEDFLYKNNYILIYKDVEEDSFEV